MLEDIISTMKVLPMNAQEKLDMAVQMVEDEYGECTNGTALVLTLEANEESIYNLPDEMFT